MSTAPPTTVAPTTVAPTTAAPTTLAPTTVTSTTLAPTTLGPTTLLTTPAPTTGAATTLAPTTFLSTTAPTTTPPPDDGIEYDPIIIANVSSIEIELTAHGDTLNEVAQVLPVEIILEAIGVYAQDIFVAADASEVEAQPRAFGGEEEGGGLLTPAKANWVKWSKIGFLDFTIDRTNEAGERPLDWHGTIYELLKLDKVIVAYGENGITILNASGVHWGMQTISRIGALNKGAIVGTENEHFFIDQSHRLNRFSNEGLELLDYSEYLELMTNPVMSLDQSLGLIYICDGTYGYIYSVRSKSFGEGPANITGIINRSGSLLVASPGTVTVPKFEICTDIYDLGTRKPKTIQWIEVGTDLRCELRAMVETRISNEGDFIKTPWKLVNRDGIAYTPCYGVEFKFWLRSHIYEFIELDYLRIQGVVHGASFLDYTHNE